ncbi:hypothetical protein MNBD_GAMMA06-1198, partial [hydrothermal vent metagenome]
VYTQYYNRQHKRVGHVYQGRYKGILVERDSYLLELSRYVVLNPVRAHMVKNISEWKWSSYKAMTGEVSASTWLETDWILSNFAKRRKIAIAKYIEFVKDGIGLSSLWEGLQNQVFLGTEKFVNKKQSLINKKDYLGEVPRLHRRKVPKSLEYYDRKYKDQNVAICNAYLSGGYTLKEIGVYFHKHYSTISRIVKNYE